MRRTSNHEREDPVVAQVRRWRAELNRDAGGTVGGMMALLRSASSSRKRSKKGTRRPARKLLQRNRKRAA